MQEDSNRATSSVQENSDCALSKLLFRGKRKLFDFQRQDVERILSFRPRPFVLHLEMGLGKTTEGWALINAERIYCQHNQIPWAPALIVAPKSVLMNWEREAKEYALWDSSEYVHLHQGSKRNEMGIQAGCVAILTTFDTVRVDSEGQIFLENVPYFSVLIVDEAHIVRNVRLRERNTPDLARTAAAVVQLNTRATLCYALTGTPYVNRDRDLVALAKLIGSENWHWLLAVPLNATRSMRRQSKTNLVDERELLRWMSESVISRRKEEVFGDQLTFKTIDVEWLELTGDEKKSYELCVLDIQELVRQSRSTASYSGRLLALITRLRQICLCEAVFLHSDVIQEAYQQSVQNPENFYSVQVQEYYEWSTKARRLFIDISACLDQGVQRVVVASESKIFLQLMSVVFRQNRSDFEILLFTGDIASAEEREKVLQKFQEASRPSILFMTRQCGGIGINLHCAQHLFVIDSWWNSAAFEQLVDRLHRFGQQLPVFVRRYTVRNSIEEFLLHHESRKHLESTKLIRSSHAEEQLAQMRFDALQQRGAGSILKDIVAYLHEQKVGD